ncbi:hypothetical protein P691DRAFT_793070 [Macrolepiota fuliginosa MF-IS2]|uniref:Alpha-ketoglutarate-dependent dioxygenase AlkB-like domain-containing protein n=1 Tax=Macrolepiota fuliginosa MF-IS2 TaxID=1400762 RepID=A0A9P5XM45_9AGAR|nr:hypothetical protein P691DRAFT_793070 [Macrolepiota fuliginosa MF-IS2]
MHRACLSNQPTTTSVCYPGGLEFWQAYFTPEEQKILLRASLHKLDMSESIKSRKRRRAYLKSSPENALEPTDLQGIFLPDECYEFQEGHYDGVIRHYREMHLAAWPEAEFESLSSVLKRLYALCPSQNVQTHLLHLGTRGYILPHIDNIHASGTWILGVSLGNERLLHLKPVRGGPPFELILPSGSVYLQRGGVRYTYEHSIEHKPGEDHGQRLSIMIRDLPSTSL